MAVADEREGFSRRLREAMRRARVQAGPTWFAREFNLRHYGDPVSPQTARKWLYGRALPTQDKLRTLALWLEASPHWLRFGEAQRGLAARQDTASYAVDAAWLEKKFQLLSEAHRKVLLEIAHALLRLEGRQ